MSPNPHILLVEDDDFKFVELATFVKTAVATPVIQRAESVRSSVVALDDRKWDLIVLDMALPGRDLRRGEVSPVSILSGGAEVIEELAYRGREDPVVIITQFPEVTFDGAPHQLRDICKIINTNRGIKPLDAILFKRLGTEWKSKLQKALEDLQ